MEKITKNLEFRAVHCRKQHLIHKSKYGRWHKIELALKLISLICTIYICSTYYVSTYAHQIEFFNSMGLNISAILINTAITALNMFVDIGKIAEEHLTVSRIYHNIFGNIQNDLMAPDEGDFEKACRYSSCATSTMKEIEWLLTLCPSAMESSADPSEEELKMERKNLELVRNLRDIRRKSVCFNFRKHTRLDRKPTLKKKDGDDSGNENGNDSGNENGNDSGNTKSRVKFDTLKSLKDAKEMIQRVNTITEQQNHVIDIGDINNVDERLKGSLMRRSSVVVQKEHTPTSAERTERKIEEISVASSVDKEVEDFLKS
jgi:hypothetical protein